MSMEIKRINVWPIILRKRRESQTIAAVSDKEGHKVYENKLINDEFLQNPVFQTSSRGGAINGQLA